MKNKLLNLLIILFCLPMLAYSKPVVIKGIVTNASSYKYAYLLEFFGTELIKKDSAIIKNNEFIFKSPNSFPRGFYQVKFDENLYINLILSQESLEIHGDLSNKGLGFKITNSVENDIYSKYKAFVETYNESMKDLQNDANKAYSLQNIDPGSYHDKMKIVKNTYDSLQQKQQLFYKNLADSAPSLFIAKFLKQLIVASSYTKDNFITGSEFNDKELLRGDVLISKVNIFFQNFVEQSVEAWEAGSISLIKKTAHTSGQEILFIALLNLFGSVDKEISHLIATEYIKAYPNSNKAKSALASLPKPSPRVGDMAPNIILPNPEGKTIELYSLKGKVVLIDFWASWCGPCRMENPNVVSLFNKYKDKGFAIYGVSLDRDKDKWLQAIDKDKLTWLHVSDLKDWKSEAAKIYGVNSIPATFLLDKEGKIIAKNLRGAQLETELKKILEKTTN